MSLPTRRIRPTYWSSESNQGETLEQGKTETTRGQNRTTPELPNSCSHRCLGGSIPDGLVSHKNGSPNRFARTRSLGSSSWLCAGKMLSGASGATYPVNHVTVKVIDCRSGNCEQTRLPDCFEHVGCSALDFSLESYVQGRPYRHDDGSRVASIHKTMVVNIAAASATFRVESRGIRLPKGSCPCSPTRSLKLPRRQFRADFGTVGLRLYLR
jgi:hypothetical protein